MNIILASSSPYRKKLLTPLIPALKCIAPQIDEAIQGKESATEYVSRLSLDKARTVAQQNPSALIIGSDQCAELEGKLSPNQKTQTKPMGNSQSQVVNLLIFLPVCVYTILLITSTNLAVKHIK